MLNQESDAAAQLQDAHVPHAPLLRTTSREAAQWLNAHGLPHTQPLERAAGIALDERAQLEARLSIAQQQCSDAIARAARAEARTKELERRIEVIRRASNGGC